MFKVNNKVPERRRRRSGIFIVNFEHISRLVLSSVSFANFEQLNAGWYLNFYWGNCNWNKEGTLSKLKTRHRPSFSTHNGARNWKDKFQKIVYGHIMLRCVITAIWRKRNLFFYDIINKLFDQNVDKGRATPKINICTEF